MLFGSCFAENMGEKFQYFKFQTAVNPFGIIFNPISILKLFERCVLKDYFTEDDVFNHNELWNSFEVHSALSNTNKTLYLNHLNQIIDDTNQRMTSMTHCIITLGTSWVYEHIDNNNVVANCHKVPQKSFLKRLLSIDEITESHNQINQLVKQINPDCVIIYTISPVRHTKDGFFENNVSKAHLFAGLHQHLSSSNQLDNYFPSYEIIMDELRDYRFFEADMIHPNRFAIDYIWEKLISCFMNSQTISLMNDIEKIKTAKSHRPFNPNSKSHQEFLKNLDNQIIELLEKNPFLKGKI